jgi:hypothetical protein
MQGVPLRGTSQRGGYAIDGREHGSAPMNVVCRHIVVKCWKQMRRPGRRGSPRVDSTEPSR